MTTIRNLWDGWNQYWFAPISAYPLCAFRILFGIYLFVFLLAGLPFVKMLYSNEGVYSPLFVGDIAPSPAVAVLIYIVTLGLAAAFTAGYRTRIATPLLLVAFLYHFLLNMMVKACSYERLILVFLFLMSFSDCGRAWSLDARAGKTQKEPFVAAWPVRLMIVELSVFYFTTGVFKVTSSEWLRGEVLHNVITSLWATPAGFWLAGLHMRDWAYCAISNLLIFWELTCGFCFLLSDCQLKLTLAGRALRLHIPAVQKIYFLFGVLFHISVWIFMDLPQFLICPLAYVLYINADEVKAMVFRYTLGAPARSRHGMFSIMLHLAKASAPKLQTANLAC